MSITRRTPTTSGTTTYTISAKTITLPTGSTTGDLAIIAVAIKPDTAGDATMDNGFTLVHSATGGTGTQGADAGAVKVNIFAKVLDGTESGITLTPGASVSSWSQTAFCYAKTLGSWGNAIQANAPWVASASDTNTAAPTTGTVTPTSKPAAGDIIEAVAVMPTDAGTAAPTTATITAAGLSGGTVTTAGSFANSSTGNDVGMISSYWSGFTGTATSTIVASLTNPSGANGSGTVTAFFVEEANSNYTQTPSDNIGLTDGSVTKAHSEVGNDDMGLTDAVTSLKGFTLTQSVGPDALGLTDSVSTVKESVQTLSLVDSMGIVESMDIDASTTTAGGGGSISKGATATTAITADATPTTLACNIPTGLTNGRVLVATVTMTGTITAHADWTLAKAQTSTSAQVSIAMYYRVITGAEASSYTFTSSLAGRASVHMQEWVNIDTTTPLDVTPTGVGTANAAGASTVIPSLTTVTDNALVLSAIGQNASSSTLTKPTEQTVDQTLGNPGKTFGLAEETKTPAGATGTRTWASTGTTDTAGIMVAWRPAAGGAGGVAWREDQGEIVTLSDSLSIVAGNVAQNYTQSPSDTMGLSDTVQASLKTVSVGPDAMGLTDSTQRDILTGGTITSLWTGGVTQSSAVVVAKLSGGAGARLKVATNTGLTTGVVYGGSATPNAQSVVRMTVTGLTAGTQYYYGVEIDGVVDTTPQGEFRTAPSGAANFAVAFASCNLSGITSDAYARALARDPDLFLITGDLHYGDITTNNPGAFRSEYDTAFAKADSQSVIMAQVPTAYTWSDHDFGANNSNSTSGSNSAANLVYRERVPNWDTLPASTGIYQTWTWGRVRFIMTDQRSFKSVQSDTDNSSKTVLGATQKQWFKDTITAATEQYIIWVGDIPWTNEAAADDEYANYNTERQELGTFIRNSGKRVMYMHGDMHSVGAHNGLDTSVSPGGLPVVAAAPFANLASTKGTYTSGPYPGSSGSNVFQYGYLNVVDDGKTLLVQFRGYDSTDTIRAYLQDSVIADDTGLTDSVSVVKTGAQTQAASDTEGLTDATTVTFGRGASVADDLGLSDAASPVAVRSSSFSDNMGLTDAAAPTVDRAQPVADTMGLSDAATTAAVRVQAASDTLGLSDATQIDFAGAKTQAANDPMGLTDTVATVQVGSLALSDTMGLSDAVSVGITEGLADSLGLADAAVSVFDRGASAADSLGLSDSLSSAATRALASTDTIGLSDAATADLARALVQTPLDPIGLSDTASFVHDSAQPVADTMGLQDSVNIAASGGQSFGETMGLADSVTFVQNRAFTIPDTLGLADTAATFGGATLAVPDAMGLSDSLTLAEDNATTVADSLGLSDTVAVAMTRVQAVNDSLGLADSMTTDAAGARTATPNDNMGLSDTATPVSQTFRTAADNLGLSDSVNTVNTGGQSPTDALGLSDAVVLTVSYTVTVADTMGLSDPLQSNAALSTTDTMGMTDALSMAMVSNRGAIDTLGLQDSIYLSVGRDVQRADNLGLTDTTVRVGAYVRSQPDDAGLSDTLVLERRTVLSEDMALTDNVVVFWSGAVYWVPGAIDPVAYGPGADGTAVFDGSDATAVFGWPDGTARIESPDVSD